MNKTGGVSGGLGKDEALTLVNRSIYYKWLKMTMADAGNNTNMGVFVKETAIARPVAAQRVSGAVGVSGWLLIPLDSAGEFFVLFRDDPA